MAGDVIGHLNLPQDRSASHTVRVALVRARGRLWARANMAPFCRASAGARPAAAVRIGVVGASRVGAHDLDDQLGIYFRTEGSGLDCRQRR